LFQHWGRVTGKGGQIGSRLSACRFGVTQMPVGIMANGELDRGQEMTQTTLSL